LNTGLSGGWSRAIVQDCPAPVVVNVTSLFTEIKNLRFIMTPNAKAQTKAKPSQQKHSATKAKVSGKSTVLVADQFVEELKTQRSPQVANQYSRTLTASEEDVFWGVRMGQVFALAKAFMAMPPGEIEKLLDSPIHEVRVGAVSIMDWQARSKKTSEDRRKMLYKLYLRRHDRINGWDLVDRSAPYVIGGYLFDKPRKILYRLTRSSNMWERRTAIVSTYYFIRQGDVDDTFKIAEVLINDDEDLIQKATGGWVREAGKKDPRRLIAFLDKYAATMPRTSLRYAIEHLDRKQRDHYLGLKQTVGG
jgi:hypothetical protein